MFICYIFQHTFIRGTVLNSIQNNSTVDENKEWVVTLNQLQHLEDDVIETLFSLGNGAIGTRGTSGYTCNTTLPKCEGTYINGAYVTESIEYDESAYGFAKFNNKMLQVSNSKSIAISTDNENFELCKVEQRSLNMKNACYSEVLELSTVSGKQIRLNILRFVSQHQQELIINNYTIEPVNFTGTLHVKSFINPNDSSTSQTDDPRVGNLTASKHLSLIEAVSTTDFSYQLQQLDTPDGLVNVATSHQFEPKASVTHNGEISANTGAVTDQFEVLLTDNSIKFTKYSVCLCEQTGQLTQESQTKEQLTSNIIEQAHQSLKQAKQLGFSKNYQAHLKVMHQFWQDSDIVIKGKKQHQLAIRLNMLHLNMSAGRDGYSNIAAKGLTGPGYDGHYFWDSEIYITPFFIYTQPEIARSLLSYRFSGLGKAKLRAQEMGHEKGALFPWRTIGGSECSSYFPAGTAQYHINAAIAYAVRHYLMATGDLQFIWDKGAELVVETGRLWPSLGHFNTDKNEQFCIDTVTGPDEYTALVNNNYYTNAMAKIHLTFACELIQQLQQSDELKFAVLANKLNLKTDEIELWQNIASNMYLAHDEARNITPQDDSFFSKKQWDFAGTAKEKYPLLLNFHPLVIYRHQVLKQADVILANFLQDDQVEVELKRNNLDFYEPITTHDSTLSACTHSIAYSETGKDKKAFKYFEETLLTDLNNLHENSQYGVHTAAMGGSWMCIIQGFIGLRMRNDYAYFTPKLPKKWKSLSFKLKIKDCQIKITLDDKHIVYQLLSGNKLPLQHNLYTFTLTSEHSLKKFILS